MRRVSASERQAAHSALCFQRAFPHSPQQYRQACRQLAAFEESLAALTKAERSRLEDSGIAGTPLYYRFSFDVALWLARVAPGEVTIDWDEIGNEERLEELLRYVLLPSEDEYFDSGYADCRDWIDLARAGFTGTDFDWLMTALDDRKMRKVWAAMYDAADIPLVWNPGNSRYSKTRNVAAVRQVLTRNNDFRRRPKNAKQVIRRPLKSIRRLPKRQGAKLIDVAMASLAARHRETYHFNHANSDEVYLADVGRGISIAVFGLLPEYRFPVECTMGYLILSNGVPIGYGGSSMLFKQLNTGLNIFDEYRGSEAAFLWVQVMRVYHALTGCTRYIANAYQFGGDNLEALQSGAFWFYYKLGFRSVDKAVNKLAASEAAKKRRNPKHRNSISTLRKLGSSDMHLTLPGARDSELFAEDWLATSSLLASQELAGITASSRAESVRGLRNKLAQALSMRSVQDWSAAERRGLDAIAPFVAAVDPQNWSREEKRAMRKLLRAKGSDSEATFARLLCEHTRFLAELKKACRRADA